MSKLVALLVTTVAALALGSAPSAVGAQARPLAPSGPEAWQGAVGTFAGALEERSPLQLEKSADVAEAHVGDTISYTLSVTNTGETPLSSVTVTDANCDSTPSGPGGDTGSDGVLEPAETWAYTCPHAVGADDADPLHNEAAVEGTDSGGGTVTGTDGTDVDVLHPSIDINKQADVAEAHAGDTVTYTLTVTNPGDTPLASVAVTDAKCDSTPSGPSGDTGDDGVLGLTETWTYTCTRLVTEADGGSLHNVAAVSAKDATERDVSASASDNVAITPRPKPNIVLLLSDDQTYSQMSALPKTTALIGGQGVTYTNFFAAFPLCCPARATIQTGQYPHNHGVQSNDKGYSHWTHRLDALGPWLHKAGYHTGYIGKFMNGYDPTLPDIPPGWDPQWWHATGGAGRYCGMILHDIASPNHRFTQYGKNAWPCDPTYYNTDVYANLAVEEIQQMSAAGAPFFLMVGFDAPHIGVPEGPGDPPQGSAEPPKRYQNAYESARLPQPPNFNEADIKDKPLELRVNLLTATSIAETEEAWQQKMETLMGLDDAVEKIYQALLDLGLVDNTIIVFTSDNGFMHGEHRLRVGKNFPYDEATHLPLLIRGPGYAPGIVESNLHSAVDLNPTILEAAGAAPSGHALDGRPLDAPARSDLVIEGRNWTALRTADWYYVLWPGSGHEQLYDVRNDPYQMQSLHGNPAYASVKANLKARLLAVKGCAGDACP